VAGGTVYVGGADGKVYALDAATGHPRWTYTTGGQVTSGPAVAGGTVYVGGADGKVYALDAATGHPRWTYTTGGSAASVPVGVSIGPAVAGGTVYVGSKDHKVYALDAATGHPRWSYTTAGTVKPHPTTSSSSAAGSSVSTPPTAPSSSASQGIPLCDTNMLSAGMSQVNAGAGHGYASLVLTNTSNTTCRILGYPSLQLETASYQPIIGESRGTGTPLWVTVAPRRQAYSYMQWARIPFPGENPNQCEPVPSVLAITLPGETTMLHITWTGGSVCNYGEIDVSPFQAGNGA
jgi:hypothetical protein